MVLTWAAARKGTLAMLRRLLLAKLLLLAHSAARFARRPRILQLLLLREGPARAWGLGETGRRYTALGWAGVGWAGLRWTGVGCGEWREG